MADVRKLLISISRQIPEVGREQIVFLSEAVLPVAKVASCKGNLSDIYECLTNSTEYKDKALHLMIFLMKSVSCPRCDELLPFIRSRVTAPIPKLALRKLLMDVANNLHGDDVQYFIRFAATDLTLNAQSFFTADANHCVGLLKLFKHALKQRVISTKDVSKLKGWLKEVENDDETIWGFLEKYSETLHLPSELPAGESVHARVRSLSGPENAPPGTPPQGEAGHMMKHGLPQFSIGSQEENIHTASSQFPQAHPDPVRRSDTSTSTTVIPGRGDTLFLNQQPITQGLQYGSSELPTYQTPVQAHNLPQFSGSNYQQPEREYSTTFSGLRTDPTLQGSDMVGVPSLQRHAQQTAANVPSMPAPIHLNSGGTLPEHSPQYVQPDHPSAPLGTLSTRPLFQEPRPNHPVRRSDDTSTSAAVIPGSGDTLFQNQQPITQGSDTFGVPSLQPHAQQTAANVPSTLPEHSPRYVQPDHPSAPLGTLSTRPLFQEPRPNSSESETEHGMHPETQHRSTDSSMQYTPKQDVPLKPRTEAQDSSSQTGNEGNKQSQKQVCVEEKEPGQSEPVFIRALSDSGANLDSSHRFLNSLRSAYEHLPETVGYNLRGVQHLNPTLYQEVSSPKNSPSQSPVSLEYVFSSESHKVTRRVLIVAKDEFDGTVVLIRSVQEWLKSKVLANTPIVLYVPMQKLAQKASIDLEDILGIYSDSFQRNDTLREHIAQNDGEGVAFLFDGLKESSISAVGDIIRGTKFSKASVYISCQPPVAAHLEASPTMVVKVGLLSEENVRNFLYSCFEDDVMKAEMIMKCRESLPTAKSLSLLPMHLAILASVVGNADLPNTDTKLVQLIVLNALRLACAREISQPPGSIELHDFDGLPAKEKQVFDDVCKLAFDLLVENRDHFTRQDLPNCSSDCKVSSLFSSLLTTSQRLTEKGLPTTVYHFIDPSIQEYLSAVYLSFKMPPEQWCQCVTDHAKLSNTLKFFCGIVGEKPESKNNFLRAFEMIVHNDYCPASQKASILPFHCAFEARSAEACTSLIRTTHQAVAIQGGSNCEMLTPSDCSTIGYVVSRTSQPVTTLDLTSCHFPSSCMESLVAQLEKPLPAIRRFDYSGTGEQVDSEAIQHLYSLLERLPYVMTLSLCSINMQHESQEKLLDCISKKENLQTLSLTRNSFTAAIGGKCGETVHRLQQLEKLDFSYNKIGDKGLEDMLPGLKMAHSLKELSLQECDLTSGRLISEIHQVKGLTHLNLRGNSLGDDGMEDLDEIVDSHLEMLNLADNRITKKGATVLPLYVQRSPHLKTLNLNMNNIPEDYIGIFKTIRPDLIVAPTK